MGLAVCADHNDKVRVLVEYKLKEPRTHCFVNSAAKVDPAACRDWTMSASCWTSATP